MSTRQSSLALRVLSVLALTFAQIAATTAVPAPPVMSPAQVSGNTVTLSWTLPFGTTGIRLEAGTAPGLSNAANTVIGTIAGYTATSVPNGVYYVRVRAIDSTGESAPSNEVTVVVGGGCSAPPNQPTLGAPAVNGNNVSFTWAAASTGCPATAFALHAGSAPGLSDIASVTVGADLRLFTAVAPPGTYYVRIFALNSSGTSAASNEVTVVVGGSGPCLVPGAPTGLAATVLPGSVTLRWNAPLTGAAPIGYLLVVGSTTGATNLGTYAVGLTTTVTSPAPNGPYFVRVVATNACGNSAPSAETFFVIGGGVLTVPAGLYVGTVSNFSRAGVAPIRSFTLQLNQPVPASSAFQTLSASWTDNRGCVKSAGIVGATTATGPFISMENFTCNDGDFGLRVTSVNGNLYSGVCSLGGPNCTFQMIRQ